MILDTTFSLNWQFVIDANNGITGNHDIPCATNSPISCSKDGMVLDSNFHAKHTNYPIMNS